MLHSINLLRTLSCYAIAIFHIRAFVHSHSDTVRLTFSASPGFHLFLAISGFILVYITRPDDTPLNFMMKRTVRIVPIYWTATTLALLLALARPWLFHEADTSLPSIISSYLFLPHYDLGGDIQPILFVGWTLGYIMLFYLLFSLSLFVPERVQVPAAILMTICVIAGARFLPAGAYREFYGDPILLEFAMGCIMGLSLRQKAVQDFVKATPMWPIGLVGIVGFAIAMNVTLPSWGRIAVYAVSSSLVVFACAGQDLFRKPLQNEFLAMGGKISYGIFLIHPLLMTAFGVTLFAITGNDWVATILMFATVLPLSSVLAYLSFRYFETPTNTWLRKSLRLSKLPPKAAREVKAEMGPTVV
ncbi:hypothetical protein HY29_03200 [Hyphomonas beringensis]|uniref:Acyltransferase 3 domain-containing protein n=1 Tax=Hyphomonas beringensis TaxID=1280946 RepID=A0A062U8M4_9PROT|nr:acyltransferase [Hyphomonas beringensis]KCZ54093.1 hypothetical protein HY29_03200 [Hyphomonas beringensis]